jgi:hypothetical protein
MSVGITSDILQSTSVFFFQGINDIQYYWRYDYFIVAPISDV